MQLSSPFVARTMKTAVAAGALLTTLTASRGASAYMVWVGAPHPFDNGLKPAVAVGYGTALQSGGEWTVEVHQAADGTGALWSSSGGDLRTAPVFGAPFSYDQGSAPSLATLNAGDASAFQVLEVHEGAPGDLRSRFGGIGSFTGPNLRWSASTFYDHGYAPKVAALNGTAVEVHQATPGVGPLWARVWGYDSGRYDDGVHPSVGLADLGDSLAVVEVHQANEGVGPLWYRVGIVNNGTIAWGGSNPYDNGMAPSIAVQGNDVMEVHQAVDGVGPLWWRDGTIVGTTILWERSEQYDYGVAPSISYSGRVSHGVEVHQASTGTGTLWTREFALAFTCAYCNDGTSQTGYGPPELLCSGHLGWDSSVGCVEQE